MLIYYFALKKQHKPGVFFPLVTKTYYFFPNSTKQITKTCHSYILLHFCSLI